jgi:hypothetical protein
MRLFVYLRHHSAACAPALFGVLLCVEAAAAEYIPETPQSPVDPTEVIARRDWLRWWIFDVSLRGTAAVVFDDNVNISAVEQQEDVIWVVTPGFTAIAGDPQAEGARILNISYSPSFLMFTKYDEYDSIDHSADLNGIWPFSKLTLGFDQDFEESNGGIVDVGNRVERKTFNTRLTSRYDLSEKTSFEINARQAITDYPEGLIGSREWISENWLNYLITAKISLGLGATFGYLDVDQSPSQTYEQALLRAVYKLTYKFDLNASAGGEFRQYDQGPNRFAPVFTLGATYWPVESTSISVQGHRDNRTSAVLSGQNYISTGIGATVRQRIWERLFLNAGATYEHSEYEAATNGVAATRADDYYVIHAGLDFGINDRWFAGLFYRHREDTSNAEGYGFTNNQVGLQTSYRF